MTFLNPMVLFGLAAASIPVILHLLNLRKLKTIEFSSLRFLKELQKSKIRRLKIKQIILLILRTLAIIFAVVAFSRPATKSNLPVFGTYAKTSTVIILDNSFSLDASDEMGSRINRARNTAKEILSKMKDGDEVSLLLMTDVSNERQKKLSRNIDLIREEIPNVKTTFFSSDLLTSLRKAYSILSESSNINKEVFIISDAQPNIFFRGLKDSLKLFDASTSVYMIPIVSGSGMEIQNLSVDSVNLVSRIFRVGKPAEIETFIRNNSKKDASGVLVSMYFNNEKVAQRTLDIPAGQVKQLTVASEPMVTGFTKGRIEIESDALEQDNKRYFGFIIPEKPKIAILGEQSNTGFIKLALETKVNGESVCDINVFSPTDFSSADLNQFDMIIVSGGEIQQNEYSRIVNFVKTGGSALVFASDGAGTQTYKKFIAELGFGNVSIKEFSQTHPAGFTTVDKLHPVFEGVFKGTTDKKNVIESPKLYKSAIVSGGQTIISIPGGAFMSESRLQDGKAIYIASAPETSWGNFPVTGIFPALLYRSIFYLSSKESAGANQVAGKSALIPLPKKLSSDGIVKVTDALNNESTKPVLTLPSGNYADFGIVAEPGVYTVTSGKGRPLTILAVNPDPTESNLEPMNNKDIKNFFANKLNSNSNFDIIVNSPDLMKKIQRTRTGSELWQMFVILALICLFAEMIIAKSSKNDIE